MVRGSWLMMVGGIVLASCAGRPADVAAPDPATTSAYTSAEDLRVQAEQAIQRQIEFVDLQPGQPVLVDNPYGDVRVRFGGYLPRLEWRTVEQNFGAEHAIAIRADLNERFELVARLPQGVIQKPSQRVDMVLYVPKGHDVEILTERGLIEARGIQAAVTARSSSGNLALRGISGPVQAQTGEGRIEAQLDTAPAGSRQTLSTTTGNIIVGLSGQFDAELELATSGVFATEFSLEIEQLPGQEPNKRARAVIGKPQAQIEISSKRGEIRLLRRAEFRPA